jgi:DNA-binding MarR family transcriptional regulator
MKEIVAPLERACHAVGRGLTPAGVTQAEVHVLARLARGPASIRDLHRSLGHKRSTLTAVLDRLEIKGFVARAPSPADRRSVLVVPTQTGRRAAARARRAVDGLERQVAKACSPADLAGFARVVDYVTSIASPKE